MRGTKTELEASVTSALKEPSLQAPFPTSFGFSFQFPWWIFFPSIVVTILIHIAEAPFFFCFFFYWWISIRLYLFWSNSLISFLFGNLQSPPGTTSFSTFELQSWKAMVFGEVMLLCCSCFCFYSKSAQLLAWIFLMTLFREP